MGDLKTSFVRNNEVEGLEERLAKAIPPYLLYVCRHWSHHLRVLPFSRELLDKLTIFVNEQLLYWFEVLSLTGNFLHVAGDMLRDTIAWMPVRFHPRVRASHSNCSTVRRADHHDVKRRF